MRVLLAAPDRDLLQCYQKILEEPYGDVVAAFDGTQVLELLAQGGFDAAVLDRALPRIGHRRILELLHRENIPVVVLQDSPITPALLLGEPLANAYLPYPFLPDELLALLQNVLEKASSKESVSLAGQELRLSAFRLPTGRPITAGEMDTLLALCRRRLGIFQGRRQPEGPEMRRRYCSGGGGCFGLQRGRRGKRRRILHGRRHSLPLQQRRWRQRIRKPGPLRRRPDRLQEL